MDTIRSRSIPPIPTGSEGVAINVFHYKNYIQCIKSARKIEGLETSLADEPLF